MGPIYRAVYAVATGRFIGDRGFQDARPRLIGEPPAPDWVNYGVAEFEDADIPDPVLHRFDPATGGKRLATAQELADAKDADVLEQAAATSRQKDVAATIALMVRYKNVAAWDAMTNNQKKAAVLAQCDEWKLLRALVEKLL